MANDSQELQKMRQAIMKIAGHVEAVEAAIERFRDSLKAHGISARLSLPSKLNVQAIRKLLES